MSDIAAGGPPPDELATTEAQPLTPEVQPNAGAVEIQQSSGSVATTDGAGAAASAATATAVFNQNIIVEHRKHGPGLFVRALWYLFVGWWLTGFAILMAWLCMLTVVLLPVAYAIVYRIPTLLTLRPRSISTDVTVEADGTIRISTGGARQRPLWLRAVWFVLVGWWLCAFAMGFAYILCLTVILIPAGLMVYNRLPEVMTLRRN